MTEKEDEILGDNFCTHIERKLLKIHTQLHIYLQRQETTITV